MTEFAIVMSALTPGQTNVTNEKLCQRVKRFKYNKRTTKVGKTMSSKILTGAVGAAIFVLGASYSHAGTLDDVKKKGFVQCGVNGSNLAGFGAQDSSGKWSGLDVDLCKAVAAAVFGDVSKVKYTPLSAKDRFGASVRRNRHSCPQHDLERQP